MSTILRQSTLAAAAVALLTWALPQAAQAADDASSFLLRGATIHPVAGPAIANGSILVQNGKIAGIGARLSAPKGVRIIEAKGLHVYPGMIDAGTELGLEEIGSIRETDDTAEIGDFNPQLRAVVAINPASEHIPVTRANGITAAVTLPRGGVVSGQPALIHLDGWTWEDMAVSPSAGMAIQFPVVASAGGRGAAMAEMFGRSRTSYAEAKKNQEAQVRKLHEFFEEARRYQRAKAAGGKTFTVDLKYEAMLPVLDGSKPVLITAIRKRAVKDALDFAEREKIKVILSQTREIGDLAPKIKERNIPVVLGPTSVAPLEQDDAYDAPFTLPVELHKAGIKFAFGTFGNQFARNLPYEAAAAVPFGLPKEEALKAVTINAAEIWGVGDRIGSIQEGRTADLVVTDGDILETRTQVKRMFVAGKEVDLDNKHLRLYKKYEARP
jgi:imidazolonepropionase-like amidohydrolase